MMRTSRMMTTSDRMLRITSVNIPLTQSFLVNHREMLLGYHTLLILILTTLLSRNHHHYHRTLYRPPVCVGAVRLVGRVGVGGGTET